MLRSKAHRTQPPAACKHSQSSAHASSKGAPAATIALGQSNLEKQSTKSLIINFVHPSAPEISEYFSLPGYTHTPRCFHLIAPAPGRVIVKLLMSTGLGTGVCYCGTTLQQWGFAHWFVTEGFFICSGLLASAVLTLLACWHRSAWYCWHRC